MFSIQIKDATWSNTVMTVQPDDGSGRHGFSQLKFGFSDKGCATCTFLVPRWGYWESETLKQFYAVDVWVHRRKIWQGRIKRPTTLNTDGLLEVECEGMSAAWARSGISTGTWTAKKPHEIYDDIITNYRQCNLVAYNGQLLDPSSTYLITKTWQDAKYETVFNEIANFGFDDNCGGEWGILPGPQNEYIAYPGNIFYWRRRDMSIIDAVIPFEALDSCQITADTEEYANTLRVRHSTGYVDVASAASQAEYTPGANHWAALSVGGTAADATRIGNVWLQRHAQPWPKGSITLGERFWRWYGFEVPPFSVIAGMNIRIPGLIQARPDLIGTVTDETVYRIMASDYSVDDGTNELTLNDYPDNVAILLARQQAKAA